MIQDVHLEFVRGPEHHRGPWQYKCGIRVADGIGLADDLLIISRTSEELEPDIVERRFSLYLPYRDPLEWDIRPPQHDGPWHTEGLRRYADILSAAEPLVDFDVAWEGRHELADDRRTQLHSGVERGWSMVCDPLEQAYLDAYRDAKRRFDQFARTPDQLDVWLTGAVALAFPDDTAATHQAGPGPVPDMHPHWQPTEPPQGWSR